MILDVMGYLALVSVLSWLAARAAAGGLRRLGRSTRWVWLAAIAAPVTLLLLPLVSPDGAARALGSPLGAIPVFELAPLVVGDAGGFDLGGRLPWLLGAAWALGTLGLTVVLFRTHFGLHEERRGWSTSTVSGREVYLSIDRGPAVAGVLRPWIVLPRWALKLPHDELDCIVLHEEEHVRARDNLLLAVALSFVVLTPWNPLTWLQLRGLKTAMEVDCDRRVLRRAPDRATYGESLLSVAARSSGLSLGLAAFTEKRRSLETRILAMTEEATRWTPLLSILLLLVAVAVGIQACYVESPILIIGDEDGEVADAIELPEPPPEVSPEPEPDLTPPRADREPRPTAEELAEEPTFTPFTVAPQILNRTEVVDAMAANYPPLLRDAGIGGTVQLFFFVDEQGQVRDIRVNQSSGHQALDRAALAVADVYRFSPARNRGDPVPVWVSFPITFQPS